MDSRKQLALWVLAAALFAAPGLALAAQLCAGCCCAVDPCAGSDGPSCQLRYAGGPCCDDPAPLLPSALKNAPDAPVFHACAPERRARPGEARASLPRPDDVEAWGRSSPLRLSVVLRI